MRCRNIYPKEIELLLDDLPVAVVVPAAGSAPDPEAVMAALAGRLARFKQPKAVHVVDALPRNAMGKVQKAELRTRFAGGFDA